MTPSENKRDRQGHFEREAKIMAGAFIVLPLLALLVLVVVDLFFHAWH